MDGELVAVRAYPYETRASRASVGGFYEDLRSDAATELDRIVTESGVTARRVVTGDLSPARALHHMAEEEAADLLVVGSTHRGQIGRVLVGGVTAGVLHHAPCPVAVAPLGYAEHPATPATIAVGFDGGEEAKDALRLAGALAKACGAQVNVLSVVATPVLATSPATFEPEWLDQVRHDGREHVDEAIRTLEQRGVTASGDVAVGGSAAEELVELSHDVDLIVVGSRGWGPVRRLLLGSTSDRLVREAACPGHCGPTPGERELSFGRIGRKRGVRTSAAGAERVPESGHVGEQRIADEAHGLHGSLTGLGVPRRARVGDDDGDEPEVRGMPHGRFDADLRRNPDNGDGGDAYAAQGELERGVREGGERQLVEYRVPGCRLELREDLRLGSVGRERRAHVLEAIHALPRAPHPQLGDAHQLYGQGDVARVVDPHARSPRRSQDLADIGDDRLAVGNLVQDPDLHVVNEESQTRRLAHLGERLRNVEAVESVHGVRLRRRRSADGGPGLSGALGGFGELLPSIRWRHRCAVTRAP
jgi:nucleotide-binding universal stress UspA family protein